MAQRRGFIALVSVVVVAIVVTALISARDRTRDARSVLADPTPSSTPSPSRSPSPEANPDALDCPESEQHTQFFTVRLAPDGNGRFATQRLAADEAERLTIPRFKERRQAGEFKSRSNGKDEFVDKDGRAVSFAKVNSLGTGFEIEETVTCAEVVDPSFR